MTARLARLMPSADSIKLCAAALIVVGSSYRVGLSVSQHHYVTSGLVLLAGGLCWQWMILRRRAGSGVTQSVAGLLQAILAVAEPERAVATPPGALSHRHRERPPALAAVKVSLANLMTFPFVREKVESGQLMLRGAHFAISDGLLHLLDEDSGKFHAIV